MAEHLISREDADALWSELREALTHTERVIVRIIETRAWEPLGYPTFAAAWAERMQGQRLATDAMKAHVLYAFFSEGLDDGEIVDALGPGSGVKRPTARRLREQHEKGVHPDDATTRVRGYTRRPATEPRRVHAELSPTDYERFLEVSRATGRTTREAAREAVLAWVAAEEAAL